MSDGAFHRLAVEGSIHRCAVRLNEDVAGGNRCFEGPRAGRSSQILAEHANILGANGERQVILRHKKTGIEAPQGVPGLDDGGAGGNQAAGDIILDEAKLHAGPGDGFQDEEIGPAAVDGARLAVHDVIGGLGELEDSGLGGDVSRGVVMPRFGGGHDQTKLQEHGRRGGQPGRGRWAEEVAQPEDSRCGIQHHERGKREVILAGDIRPEAPEQRVVETGNQEEQGAPDAHAALSPAPAVKGESRSQEHGRNQGEDKGVPSEPVPAFQAGHDIMLHQAVPGLDERGLVPEEKERARQGERWSRQRRRRCPAPVREHAEWKRNRRVASRKPATARPAQASERTSRLVLSETLKVKPSRSTGGE